MRGPLVLTAGFVAALAVAGWPASAANTTIAAYSYTAWNPPDVTIAAGDDVTWTNPTGLAHNVCVAAAGAAAGCGEYRSGETSDTWPSGGFTHRFAAAGTYTYICEAHKAYGMTGTITVTATSTGTGTGTSTTPPPDTMPTDTITVPTQTSPATDTSAPGFVGKPKRRASRRSLIVELRSSEDATLKATVFRRPPRGRSFSRITEASLQVKQGKNVVTLPRKARPRSGAYRVRLQLTDPAGNKSPTVTISFKVA